MTAAWQRENMSRKRLAILPGLSNYDIFNLKKQHT